MPPETVKNPEADIRTTMERVLEDGVFLAVRLPNGDGLVESCRAAARGGLPLLELTLTTPGALAAIEALAGRHGVEMPICAAVDAVLHKSRAIDETLAALLARPFKAEA